MWLRSVALFMLFAQVLTKKDSDTYELMNEIFANNFKSNGVSKCTIDKKLLLNGTKLDNTYQSDTADEAGLIQLQSSGFKLKENSRKKDSATFKASGKNQVNLPLKFKMNIFKDSELSLKDSRLDVKNKLVNNLGSEVILKNSVVSAPFAKFSKSVAKFENVAVELNAEHGVTIDDASLALEHTTLTVKGPKPKNTDEMPVSIFADEKSRVHLKDSKVELLGGYRLIVVHNKKGNYRLIKGDVKLCKDGFKDPNPGYLMIIGSPNIEEDVSVTIDCGITFVVPPGTGFFTESKIRLANNGSDSAFCVLSKRVRGLDLTLTKGKATFNGDSKSSDIACAENKEEALKLSKKGRSASVYKEIEEMVNTYGVLRNMTKFEDLASRNMTGCPNASPTFGYSSWFISILVLILGVLSRF